MSYLRELAPFKFKSDAGRDLAFALIVQASLVQEFSDNPANPNVSAWLRSGAIECIQQIEDELS